MESPARRQRPSLRAGQNPTPEGRYNLVVIGAGTGGLITALIASSLGARGGARRAAPHGWRLPERGLRALEGGDPRGADRARGAEAARFGMPDRRRRTPADFAAVMRADARDPRADQPRGFRRALLEGVRHRRLSGRCALRGRRDASPSADRVLEYAKAVIATGAGRRAADRRALRSGLSRQRDGLLADRASAAGLAVIGAGPIGCELAQSFRRLGSEVFDPRAHGPDPHARGPGRGAHRPGRAGSRKASRWSSDATSSGSSGAATSACSISDCPEKGARRARRRRDPRRGRTRAERRRDGARGGRCRLRCRGEASRSTTRCVRRTHRIWAVGDVCMQWKFTHAADAAAKIVVQNALFARRSLRSQEALRPRHALVHLHRARDRPRRPLRTRCRQEKGIAIDTYQVVHRRGEPRRDRRAGGRTREGARQEGHGPRSSAPPIVAAHAGRSRSRS